MVTMPSAETKSVKPIQKPKLPDALPEEVVKAAHEFKRWKNSDCMSAMVRRFLGRANLSADDNGGLLLVFENPVDVSFLNTEDHKQEIKDAIAQYIGKNMEIDIRGLEPGRKFDEQYADLEGVAAIDFEINQEV